MALRAPATRMYEILKGERAITPETALRLARYLALEEIRVVRNIAPRIVAIVFMGPELEANCEAAQTLTTIGAFWLKQIQRNRRRSSYASRK